MTKWSHCRSRINFELFGRKSLVRVHAMESRRVTRSVRKLSVSWLVLLLCSVFLLSMVSAKKRGQSLSKYRRNIDGPTGANSPSGVDSPLRPRRNNEEGPRLIGLCPDHPSVRGMMNKLNKTLDKDIHYVTDRAHIKRQSAANSQIVVRRIKSSNDTDTDMCEYAAVKQDYPHSSKLTKASPTSSRFLQKRVTTFAQSSSPSNFGGTASDGMNDFDFKDTTNQQQNNYDVDSAGSDNAYGTVWTYPSASANSVSGNSNYNNLYGTSDQSNTYNQYQSSLPSGSNNNYNNAFAIDYGPLINTKPTTMTRYSKPKEVITSAQPSTNNNKYHSGSFYTKEKTEDFKVFHNIPSSSHLLANYDPFYSPLLSRMDSVFKQLGYNTELCRERLVCNMYKNPAKYAPFSNLVSAQLSRELNELRKPSSDNPEILRFFRYMKAAKDGQDGQECEVVYGECTSGRGPSENAPMVTTFNDINKLVQARSAN